MNCLKSAVLCFSLVAAAVLSGCQYHTYYELKQDKKCIEKSYTDKPCSKCCCAKPVQPRENIAPGITEKEEDMKKYTK